MKLIIEDDEGRKTVVPVVRDEITIGRNDDCLVRLSEKNVSRKHGRLLRQAGQFFIEDLNSFTGIRVNGERIAGRQEVHEGDLIQISEYDLSLQAAPGENAKEGQPAPAAETVPDAPAAETDAEAEARKLAETATIRLSDLAPLQEAAEQREVPVAERPRLVGISGTYRGRELVLDRTPIRLGRSGENDIEIDHPSISRRQCRLHLEAGTWKVMDAESKNGVRVNGEPYAAIGLRNGDVVEMGHLRFAFVAPGQPFKLPAEFAPVPGTASQPSQGKAGVFAGIAIGALVAVAALYFFTQRKSSDDEQAFALRSVEQAASAHRYGEALRSLEAARRAGAKPSAMAGYATLPEEARGEDLFREMESAAASQDWDRARKLLSVLGASKTFYGAKAAEKADSITAGYVNLHVAAAALMKGKDNAGCLSEAQLALAANAQSTDAQSLLETCKAPPAAREPAAGGARVRAAPDAAPPVKTSSVVAQARSARPENDAEARRLVSDGNQKLMGQDFAGALSLYQKALALKPSNAVLGGAYRSMGIAYTRSGDVEQGARYYKLYLPLCTNPQERAALQKTLDDYDARQKQEK